MSQESILVTVKAHSDKASRRTKNRAGGAVASMMWLDKISHPDCMGGRKCGLFKSTGHSAVESGKIMSGWFGWLPLNELIIRKDGKFLDLT